MLTQMMVTCSIIGIIAPTVYQLSTVPAITMARQLNFQRAELAATGFMTAAVHKNTLPAVPPACNLNTDNAETFNYTITCTEGKARQVVAKASRSFSLLSPDGASSTVSGLGVYADEDRDGIDDVTGLLTHYAECYSGWKGYGSLKNNCDLGGPYVIKAYAHLYE